MDKVIENMKNWASQQEANPELEKDIERILEQRRKDEAEHWLNVPELSAEELAPKIPSGCKWVAVLLALGFLSFGVLGLWKTIEIILSWI
ncbi:hypothetical protein [Chryseobacterium sp. MP_3.2]|uniref:hypothetical protein n=1 Tax=Chryseobacterium sp. MP_3.2 TaxID=3071712 RepID=UPI002E001448|nr:hypothetical protein [Chryseobacterium sp. MP_3.2]